MNNRQRIFEIPRLRNGATRCPNKYEHFVFACFRHAHLGLAIYSGWICTSPRLISLQLDLRSAGDFVSVISVALAIPASRALARQNFKGREVLILSCLRLLYYL